MVASSEAANGPNCVVDPSELSGEDRKGGLLGSGIRRRRLGADEPLQERGDLRLVLLEPGEHRLGPVPLHRYRRKSTGKGNACVSRTSARRPGARYTSGRSSWRRSASSTS